MNYFESNIKQNNDLARKRPKQGRSKFTVDAILEAATRILIADGYASFNTNRVAEVAGVSVGSLYQYFPNKEAIVAALWERYSRIMRENSMSELEPFFDQALSVIFKELIRIVVDAHRRDQEFLHIMLTRIPRGDLKHINKAAENDNCDALLELIEAKRNEVRDDIDLHLALRLIHALIENVVNDGVTSNPEILHSEKIVDELHHMVMQYLVP